MDDDAERDYQVSLAALDALARFPELQEPPAAPPGADPLLAAALQAVLSEDARLHRHMRDFTDALVRYMQVLLPLVDTRDRVASAEVTVRSERALEAIDRRLEAQGR
jgi:hypothetical protein